MIGFVADRHLANQDFARARDIYEQFEGNVYYMALDGQLETYESFRIPKSTETTWLAEMTTRHLSRLDAAGNWRVVHFLWLHGDCRHLELLSRQAPRGVLWERITFLEHLLDYADLCRGSGRDGSRVAAVIEHVLVEVQRLRRACRSDQSKARVERLSDRARSASAGNKPSQ
jgi:hypothetical protein